MKTIRQKGSGNFRSINAKPVDELKVRVKVRRGTPDRITATFRLTKSSVIQLTAAAKAMDVSKTKAIESMIEAVSLMRLDKINRLPYEVDLVNTLEAVRDINEKLESL